MSLASCPVSGSAGGQCPVSGTSRAGQMRRGCAFSGMAQPGDIHAAFDIPRGVDVEDWLRTREQKSINELLYTSYPSRKEVDGVKTQQELDNMNANDHHLLAVALGAPARQVMRRAEEIGPQTGWRDGYLSVEHGFCPPDYEEPVSALARSPGRIWSDLCERMPGCCARGRVREAVAALPLVEGTEEFIPDQALWAAVVALGMLCSIYRFEDKHDGKDGVAIQTGTSTRPQCPMGDDLCEELVGIPLCIALPYFQISRRMGRILPHLSFPDQASYNLKIRDPKSNYPYLARFENTDLRWPMFGERAEVAFLKGCADTSASFQHGPDAIAACQEHVMTGNVEGLLHEMIRLKEILERMPNAFHSISPNPNAGDNYVSADRWVRWGLFSAPLSRRCPAASGLQFPPYLMMDAFLGRKTHTSFLGVEAVHLRAWLPSNHRAFIAAIQYHYSIPEFVQRSGDPRLMGVLEGIVEAYAGERGFMGVHRYKVFGILEIAGKTGRTATNGLSGAADATRPWEETHRQFSEAMKERLEPFRGKLDIEPHSMRGTFQECRYVAKVAGCSAIDMDPSRSTALVTLDIRDTGITFAPGDRVAVMPLNSWEECAKMVAALGLDQHLEEPVDTTGMWSRFEQHLSSVKRSSHRQLTVIDILRRGHLAPITKELAVKVHELLHASSNTVLQVLATEEWPVGGSLGDLLQKAITDTPPQIWDKAFSLDNLDWLPELVQLEVPRTYSISSHTNELLPNTVDLTISRAEYKLGSMFSQGQHITRAGVSSGFFNPHPSSAESSILSDDVLLGVSRPVAFQLPIDHMAPCAFFAGGSGIAPFRSFWQHRLQTSGLSGGRNLLYLGVQSRERFCYENELRKLVNMGFMEVHLAFSRDPRGLAHDDVLRDLVEKETPPRYIDSLIIEQGATVCDMVMSKKQGGLGGYLYVCGSVSVFDSVMSGIRKAMYTYRTATMETVDLIINKAFAERRFMLDVFMSPKALPCNLPTISLSNLALHTGHRPGSRMWIAVHGSVYDVTDFCPMHPGGTLIIKSNAGVDCTNSFDNLAHTNNPEVSSLLTRYFIGHLSPKPDYHGDTELSTLHDLWSAYLRVTVETLVAHQFEMHEIMGASIDSPSAHDPNGITNIWLREGLPNIIALRTFYGYQSRLLQGGFAALFGPKLEELVLRLSFSFASAGGPGAAYKLPDILGTIARAKTSQDAAHSTKEISSLGDFICDPSSELRFQERGVFSYATKSVQLDIELLENLRQEACNGMDAFESIASVLDSPDKFDADSTPIAALSAFLLQTLERMAHRLSMFYAQLARLSVYQPELEHNPARTRWASVRRCIRDGTFFVLTQAVDTEALMDGQSNSYYMSGKSRQKTHFESILSQVNERINSSSAEEPSKTAQPTSVNAIHHERGRTVTKDTTVASAASRLNVGAIASMESFMKKNKTEIRRLSTMPSPFQLEHLQKALSSMNPNALASSHGVSVGKMPGYDSLMSLASRTTGSSRKSSFSAASSAGSLTPYPNMQGPPTPPSDANMALQMKLVGLNRRQRTQSTTSMHNFTSASEVAMPSDDESDAGLTAASFAQHSFVRDSFTRDAFVRDWIVGVSQGWGRESTHLLPNLDSVIDPLRHGSSQISLQGFSGSPHEPRQRQEPPIDGYNERFRNPEVGQAELIGVGSVIQGYTGRPLRDDLSEADKESDEDSSSQHGSAGPSNFKPSFNSQVRKFVNEGLHSLWDSEQGRQIQEVTSEILYSLPDSIEIVENPARSLTKRLRDFIHIWFGSEWDWSLLGPSRNLPLGYTLLVWKCVCQDTRIVAVPELFAQGLVEIRKPLSHGGSPQSQSSRNLQPYPRQSPVPMQQSPVIATAPSVVIPMPVNIRHVHFMVDSDGLRHRAFESQFLSNEQLFDRLRLDYRQLKGWFRTWFGLSIFSHCDFYRFEMWTYDRFCERERGIPPHSEDGYFYEPRPMDSEPPISKHEFYDRSYQRVAHERLMATHGSLYNDHDAVDRIPQKEGLDDIGTRGRQQFWGIIAREKKSGLRMLIYILVSSLPGLIFLFLWLFVLDQDGLQDASTLLILSFTLLGVVYAAQLL
ncbi:Cytochrome b5 heme-binding domain-containing protein [Fusarium keratoplasticum]|uniref:Cytochrome b5 heme-binding domain-containing protein n=1 Tax=Fusarium keratoplasticum TaxID=1328300 RepID=A0ACC0QHM9_9HYPO|nr:Cytochrome b5 heme-binding domain-containing protein [Fusarium keratoplasticum]KAI8652845.1 Cytochrome b5 heme-binding domain-containing protein [Fusarium keratoplasticum]